MIKQRNTKKKEMFNIMQESLRDKEERERKMRELEEQERLEYKLYLENLDQRKEQLFKEKEQRDNAKEAIYM